MSELEGGLKIISVWDQHLAFTDGETEAQSPSQDRTAERELNLGSHHGALTPASQVSCPPNLPPDNLFCPENSAICVQTVVVALEGFGLLKPVASWA